MVVNSSPNTNTAAAPTEFYSYVRSFDTSNNAISVTFLDISNIKKISWSAHNNGYAKDVKIMVSKGVATSNGAYGYSTEAKIFESTSTSGSYDCSGIQGIYGFAVLCKTSSSTQNGSLSVKWNVEYN